MASAVSLSQACVASSAAPRVALAVAPSEKDCKEIQDILSAHGISVRQAVSWWEALLLNVDADIILYDTDVRDSWQKAVVVLHHRWPDCPVVLVSRLADDRLWIEALTAGVRDVLPKPFLPLELDCVLRGVRA